MGLCSAISFKRSRRELAIDVAEHVYVSWKITKIRITPVYPTKTGIVLDGGLVFTVKDRDQILSKLTDAPNLIILGSVSHQNQKKNW